MRLSFHGPTSCMSTPATLKSPILKFKGKKQKWRQCGSYNQKCVFFFFFKQHINHLYIYIKENAYIHWIFVGFAWDLQVKKKMFNRPCSPILLLVL